MRTVAMIGLAALTTLMVGCPAGEPRYAPESRNSVKIHRGAFGADLKIHNGSDTNARVDKATYNALTKDFLIEGLVFESAQSKNQRELLEWMKVYGQQQVNYNEIRRTEWAGLNSLATTGLQYAGMALQAYQGNLTLKEMQLAKPTIIEGALELIRSGTVAPGVLLGGLPPDISAEVKQRIQITPLPVAPTALTPEEKAALDESRRKAAAIRELEPVVDPPTTQPTDPVTPR